VNACHRKVDLKSFKGFESFNNTLDFNEGNTMKNYLFAATLLLLAAKPVFAHGKGGASPECKKIADACKAAGFVKGDWKKGDGLWRDCVDPIVQGQTTVPGATKPLPTVDAAVVTACKASNPKFGEGKVGSK
jgi:hypothetical protein